MALVKDYLEKTIQYQNEYGEKTVLLMQVGSFFEIYALKNSETEELAGSQIKECCRICDLNIANKNTCVGKEGVVMAGFSTHVLDKYLKKLQEAGYTVVVYVQDIQEKNTTRSLAGIYSPGTYFSPDFSQITNNTCCIWIQVVDCFTPLLKKSECKKETKRVCIGLANMDVYTGKSSVFEFQENMTMNPTTFDQMERFLSINNPSEVIFIANLCEKDMDIILNYTNVQSLSIHKISLFECENERNERNGKGETGLKSLKNKTDLYERVLNCEKQKYQKQVLEKFYQIDDFDIFYQPFYENSMACQAFCFLLDFVNCHNPILVRKIQEPVFENCSDSLILANHSLKQLNMIDDGQYNGPFSSVEKMMNLCVTNMGKRKFSHDLLHPTTNVERLEEEYAIIEHFISIHKKYRDKFSVVRDISKLKRQIILKRVSPKTLVQFYKNLLTIEECIAEMVETDSVVCHYLEKRGVLLKNVKESVETLKQIVVKNIVFEYAENIDAFSQFEVNFIKFGVNTELDQQTKRLFDSEKKLESIRFFLNSFVEKYEKSSKNLKSVGGTEYIKIDETEKNHFSLITTKRRGVILKQCFKEKEGKNGEGKNGEGKNGEGKNGDESGDGTGDRSREGKKYTLKYGEDDNESFEFQTNEIELTAKTGTNDSIRNVLIDNLCKDIYTVKTGLKDLLTRVYLSFLDELEKEGDSLMEYLVEFVTLLDVVSTKAFVSQKYNYCRPKSIACHDGVECSFLKCENLRHVLIERIQQNEIYVANDLCIEKENMRGVLLYGTNAVGKTSFIRSVGIAVIMAQAGMYVPATSFEFSPYKTLFTRILGNDNIFKGLSTFAVEMSELRTILRLADKNSLILGDELCSGTESISAISIFVAGIQELYKKESHFLFATHLHEIIKYDEIVNMKEVSLKHMAVVYDRETNALKYDRKLRDGPGDNMYGLEVCKSLHLPESFLNLANEIRMKYHPMSGSIFSLKSSHYNSEKIVGVCEMCKEEMGKEVHHLRHQKMADERGVIVMGAPFQKNHLANLVSVCEKCHDLLHAEKGVTHKRVKTSRGGKIVKDKF